MLFIHPVMQAAGILLVLAAFLAGLQRAGVRYGALLLNQARTGLEVYRLFLRGL